MRELDVGNAFAYIRSDIQDLRQLLGTLPPSRNVSLALTKLDEAEMWALRDEPRNEAALPPPPSYLGGFSESVRPLPGQLSFRFDTSDCPIN